ncbi:MAG: FAD-dependent oxidoreductase [Proteobacteria bacterium]|nr:FAD-dependent oxidoreductase [Pseudomonadota bacterium]MBU1389767.1 FAD-dependent oxidoreductase [Pseudomonadota bacterium]MBU1543776.1 FAD-dependent oxidoreductase [Pseudomonadota bacterium]MBU2480131.1 FAD-dependent oxidoreductase [Pseudomonadota bacterium]
MTFVIIGGDAAGMSAASRARRLAPDMEIIVLEQTFDVSYSACSMPYNIAEPGIDMENLVVRKADVFIAKNKINLLTGHRVTAIDRGAKKVSGITIEGALFAFDYDTLFIATGAAPVIPQLPGFDRPEVMALKSLAQGKIIKSYIKQHQVKTAVIVGMGYIALEMCEAFEKRQIKTSMVKPGPVFLPWLPSDLADVIYKELIDNGIDIYSGHEIKKIESTDTGVRVVCEDLELDADMVLAAIGVKPCSELAGAAGLELGISDAIAVDPYLKTSDENIYSAGDCADAYHVVTDNKCWIPLALRANRAGWAVADNVCGTPARVPGVAGTSVFKVFSLEVARSGLTFKEAQNAGFDPVENVIESQSRAHSQTDSTPIYVNMVADKKTGRLLGAQMVGNEGVAHRINAVAVALHSKMTVEDFFQTDLAYAPPFGPVWDPLLTAANQLLKKL